MKKISQFFVCIILFFVGLFICKPVLTVFALGPDPTLGTITNYSFAVDADTSAIQLQFTLDNNSAVRADTYSINLTEFSYYQIYNQYTDKPLYLIGDVAEECISSGNHIVKIAFYNDDCYNRADNEFEFEFYHASRNCLYTLEGSTSDEVMRVIKSNATDHDFCYDAISNRLRVSLNYAQEFYQTMLPEETRDNYYYNYQGLYTNATPTEYDVFVNDQETVVAGVWDAYTNSDRILLSYKDDYFLKNWDAEIGNIQDDMIVTLIPKSVFLNNGTYTYIGREYGFFAKTSARVPNTSDPYSTHYTDILLFDIIHEFPGFDNNTTKEGYIRMHPLYQLTFRGAEPTFQQKYSFGYPFLTSLNSIVYADALAAAGGWPLAVESIRFKTTLMSTNYRNYGHALYEGANSHNDYFTQVSYNINGHGSAASNNDWFFQRVRYYMGGEDDHLDNNIMMHYMGVRDSYRNYGPHSSYPLWDNENVEWDGEYNTYNLGSRAEQYAEYGYPVNSVYALPMSYSFAQPIVSISHTGNYYYYAEFRYRVASTPSDKNESVIWHASQMFFYRDTTWISEEGGINGDIVLEDNGDSCYAYGAFCSYPTLFTGDSITGNVTRGGARVYFQFTPTVSGNYYFYTEGTNDTYLELFGANGILLDTGDDTDIGEEELDLNASIYHALTANQTYIIRGLFFPCTLTGTFNLHKILIS